MEDKKSIPFSREIVSVNWKENQNLNLSLIVFILLWIFFFPVAFAYAQVKLVNATVVTALALTDIADSMREIKNQTETKQK